MANRFRQRSFAASVIAVLVLGRAAGAQPRPPAIARPAPREAPAAASAEALARAHFKKGNAHFDKQEWLEALGEFRQALALKRNRAAVIDEASCLKQLGRYDEALEAYEALRTEFPDLPPRLEAKVAPAIAELRGLVGTLVLAGDAPAGASLFVDDRPRGKLPLSGPIRVGIGRRVVRVEKERFDPIVATVVVGAGKEATAELRAKSRKGRLEVREKHNWVLEVEIDGRRVGVTPWEGLLEPGDHRVALKGFVGLDALAECTALDAKPAAANEGASMGSPVVTAPVRLYEVTPVMLGAEELDASLRIESIPSGASVTIDNKGIGQTPWEGRLGLGEHAIEITAAGFFPAKQQVRLERRKQRELQVALEREPNTAGLRMVRNVGAGVGYGVGALGLGVFAVAGGLAVAKTRELESACPNHACYLDQQANLDKAAALGTASTVGLVIGSIGVVAGTVVLLVTRPRLDDRRKAGKAANTQRPATLDWSAGLGRLTLEGSF